MWLIKANVALPLKSLSSLSKLSFFAAVALGCHLFGWSVSKWRGWLVVRDTGRRSSAVN